MFLFRICDVMRTCRWPLNTSAGSASHPPGKGECCDIARGHLSHSIRLHIAFKMWSEKWLVRFDERTKNLASLGVPSTLNFTLVELFLLCKQTTDEEQNASNTGSCEVLRFSRLFANRKTNLCVFRVNQTLFDTTLWGFFPNTKKMLTENVFRTPELTLKLNHSR